MRPLLETRTQSLNYADLPEARQVSDIGRFSAAQNPVRLSDGRFAESRSRFLIDGYRQLFRQRGQAIRRFKHGKWRVSVELSDAYRQHWLGDPAGIFVQRTA